MMQWIAIEALGVINARHIVAIGAADSAAARRLLAALPLSKIVGLTGGRRRNSIIVLDSDHVILSALSVAEISALLVNLDAKDAHFDG